jgi:cobalamin biosynthesis protein CobT
MNAKPTDSFKARMEQIVAESIANDQAKRAPKTNFDTYIEDHLKDPAFTKRCERSDEEWDEKIGRDRQERLLGVSFARP